MRLRSDRMDNNPNSSLPLLSLAPRPLLARKLLEAISRHSLWQPASGISSDRSPIMTSEMIPLYRSKDRSKDAKRILYISGIALKLEKIWRQSPIEIATGVAPLIPTSPDFTVAVVPPGWIHLQLTDIGIANFLQGLVQNAYAQYSIPHPQEAKNSILCKGQAFKHGKAIAKTQECLPREIGDRENIEFLENLKLRTQNLKLRTPPQGVFPIQYASARCYSLLRSACQEGLIVLCPLQEQAIAPDGLRVDVQNLIAQNLVAQNISWLDERGQLRLLEPRELALISRLMATLDALARTPEPNKILKLALALAEDFQKFYSACRIWGKVKLENPDLARGRLGLILGTQKLLKLLLEEGLGVVAPVEL